MSIHTTSYRYSGSTATAGEKAGRQAGTSAAVRQSVRRRIVGGRAGKMGRRRSTRRARDDDDVGFGTAAERRAHFVGRSEYAVHAFLLAEHLEYSELRVRPFQLWTRLRGGAHVISQTGRHFMVFLLR